MLYSDTAFNICFAAALATAATWAITYHNKSWHRHRELLLFVLAAIHYTTYVGLVGEPCRCAG